MARERVKKQVYQKITGGFLKLPGMDRRIKPHEKVELTEEQVALAPNQFKLLGSKSAVGVSAVDHKKKDTTPIKGQKYTIKVATPGWYDVFSEGDKQMNNTKLREDAAKALVDRLESATA